MKLGASLALLATILCSAAQADELILTPVAVMNGADGGSTSDPVLDGQFTTMFPGSWMYVNKRQSDIVQSETRSLYEFVLPPELTGPGVTLNNAWLQIPIRSGNFHAPARVLVYDYVADGSITVDDFEATSGAS